MKKTATMLCASLLLTIGFFSCGKEVQTISPIDSTFKIKVTIVPPLQHGQTVISGSVAFNGFRIFGIGYDLNWFGPSEKVELSELTTGQIPVKSGQNLDVNLVISNTYDHQCRNVKIEGILNDKIIKSYILSMGYSNLNNSFCADGMEIKKNFTIQ